MADFLPGESVNRDWRSELDAGVNGPPILVEKGEPSHLLDGDNSSQLPGAAEPAPPSAEPKVLPKSHSEAANSSAATGTGNSKKAASPYKSLPKLIVGCLLLVPHIGMGWITPFMQGNDFWVAASAAWFAFCLLRIFASARKYLEAKQLVRPHAICATVLFYQVLFCLGGIMTNNPYRPEWLTATLELLPFYYAFVLANWTWRLGGVLDRINSASSVDAGTRTIDWRAPVLSALAILSALAWYFLPIFAVLTIAVMTVEMRHALKIKLGITDKPNSGFEAQNKLVLIRYKAFAFIENWLKDRFKVRATQKLSQRNKIIAILAAPLLIALGFWLSTNFLLALVGMVKIEPVHYASQSPALSKTNYLVIELFVGIISIIVITAVIAYRWAASHLALSERGFALARFAGRNLTSRKVIPWGDVTRILIERPAGSTRTSEGTLTFERSSAQPFRLKLACVDAVEDREKLLKAIETWAPSVPRDADVIQYLQPPPDHSYTELWMQALAAPPKRDRLKPLIQGASLYQGHYSVLATLGVGGQGSAYLARDNVTQEQVVLKEFILPVYVDMNVRRKALNRFENEAKILSELNHPLVVRLENYFIEDQRAYLVLEHINGQSLRSSVLTSGALPEEQVQELARQMCSILQYLHSLSPPVVHRDFTPDNLILRSDGTLKLIDFNVAHQDDSSGTTTVVGKHAYLPPEQFRGEPCPQSDIYAMGATLYFLLTGGDPSAITQSFPANAGACVTANMNALVAKATALAPSERFQTIKDLGHRLEYIVAQSPLAPQESGNDDLDEDKWLEDSLDISQSSTESDATRGNDESTGHELPAMADHGQAGSSRSGGTRLLWLQTIGQICSLLLRCAWSTPTLWLGGCLAATCYMYFLIPSAPEFLDPDWGVHQRLFRARQSSGKDANKTVDAILTENPRNIDALRMRLDLQIEGDKWDEAIATLNQLQSLDPNNDRGSPLSFDWQHRYQGLTISQPARFFFCRASCYLQQSNYEFAVDDYTRALRALGPLDHLLPSTKWRVVQMYSRRADANLHLGRMEHGFEDADKAFNLDDSLTFSALRVAVSREVLQQTDEAIAAWENVNDLESPMIEHYDYGPNPSNNNSTEQVQFHVDMLTKARALLRAKPELHTGELAFTQGLGYYDLNDYDKALPQFDTVLDLDPDFVSAYILRASCFEHGGQYDKALQDLNQALHLDTASIPARFLRAEALSGLGRYAQALADADQVIAAHKVMENDALVLKARIYLLAKQPQKALEILEGEKTFHSWLCTYMKALAYAQEGRNKEAIDEHDSIHGAPDWAVREITEQHAATEAAVGNEKAAKRLLRLAETLPKRNVLAAPLFQLPQRIWTNSDGAWYYGW